MGGRCVGGCSQIAQPDTPGMEGLRHKTPSTGNVGISPARGFCQILWLPRPPSTTAPPGPEPHSPGTAEPLGTGPQSSRGSGVLPSDLPATLWAARAKK